MKVIIAVMKKKKTPIIVIRNRYKIRKSILVICQELNRKDFGIYLLKKGALNKHTRNKKDFSNVSSFLY